MKEFVIGKSHHVGRNPAESLSQMADGQMKASFQGGLGFAEDFGQPFHFPIVVTDDNHLFARCRPIEFVADAAYFAAESLDRFDSERPGDFGRGVRKGREGDGRMLEKSAPDGFDREHLARVFESIEIILPLFLNIERFDGANQMSLSSKSAKCESS